jgi:hypothetical protein
MATAVEEGTLKAVARYRDGSDRRTRTLRTPRQFPFRPNEVAGVAGGVVLEIVLMFGLGFPEITRRRQFGHDLARPQTGRIDIGNGVFGNFLLRVAGVEDG